MSEVLRAGYKLTEVGVIPEDWEAEPIGRCLKIRHGKSQHEVVSASGEYPIFGTGGEMGRASRPLYSKPSVLIGRKGTIDAPRYLDTPFWTVDTLFYSEVFENVDAKFMFYQFCLVDWYSYNEASGVPSLNAKTIEKIQIPLPPSKLEQRAIAAALSDIDALLAKLDELIAKKRNIKQATMQQLLTGQTRLPGFSGEWDVKTIKSIVQTPVTDGPHLTPQFFETGIPFLSVNNLVDNKIDMSDLRFISQKDHEDFSKKCKPRRGDLLLGKAASVGKVAIVDTDIEFNIWSPIAMVRIGRENISRFIYYQLQTSNLIKQVTLLTNSSSQGNIGMGDIEKLVLQLPSADEQTAIATILSDMDTELVTLEARRDKTLALKQGMMQELLTGRIRLV